MLAAQPRGGWSLDGGRMDSSASAPDRRIAVAGESDVGPGLVARGWPSLPPRCSSSDRLALRARIRGTMCAGR